MIFFFVVGVPLGGGHGTARLFFSGTDGVHELIFGYYAIQLAVSFAQACLHTDHRLRSSDRAEDQSIFCLLIFDRNSVNTHAKSFTAEFAGQCRENFVPSQNQRILVSGASLTITMATDFLVLEGHCVAPVQRRWTYRCLTIFLHDSHWLRDRSGGGSTLLDRRSFGSSIVSLQEDAATDDRQKHYRAYDANSSHCMIRARFHGPWNSNPHAIPARDRH